MKFFKAFFAVILACCCMLSAIPTMAAKVEANDNWDETSVEARGYPYANRFVYDPNSTTDMTFKITKSNINHFNYTSGPFGASYIVIRFTNIETGAFCSHSIGGSANSSIKCNIGIGTYRVTITQNANAAGYFSLVFSN